MRQRTIDLHIFGDTFRIIAPYRYDMGRPVVFIGRSGPNGSPAGHGPKGFPAFMVRDGGRWSNVVKVPLPYISWRTGYRLRRVGGIRLHVAVSRFYGKVMA